jgi:hypothetical protein
VRDTRLDGNLSLGGGQIQSSLHDRGIKPGHKARRTNQAPAARMLPLALLLLVSKRTPSFVQSTL